jgi:predicted Ser/Thr protein kinase
MEGREPSPDLFVQLGVLDAGKLQTCLETQKSFQTTGVVLSLPQVILNLGLATPQAVARVLAHQGTAVLRCPACRRRFTVPEFQANRRYKCEPCNQYLEVVPEETAKAPESGPASAPAPSHPGPSSPAAPQAAAAGAPGTALRKDPFEDRVFGKVRIVRRLAKGGMGAVYLGENTETGQKLAVKILTEEFSKMPGIQGRFKREAQTTQRLEHPNIVATYEMASEGPYIYIVSEYVDGGSLVDLIVKERKLAPVRAVEITCDILSALHHAHGRGVIHRDIKPANVLLTAEGRAKVIDFGLARDAESNTILTLSGNVVGTPAFMAPEQATGDPAGPMADLYSAGILCWLMLTGRKPFEGRSIIDTLQKQIHDPLPPARASNPDVPENLDQVLRKVCAKQPDKRYSTIPDAIAALRHAVGLAIEKPAAAAPTSAAAPPAGPEPAPSTPSAGTAADWEWVWPVAGLAALGAAVLWRLLQG